MGWIRVVALTYCLALSVSAQETASNPEPKAHAFVRGTHLRLTFVRDVERVAVGDVEIATELVLNGREILFYGESVGRTSVLVWYTDKSMESFELLVQPDLGILQEALQDIHPSIRAEMALDRDAIVLRGTVPEISFSQAAEDATRNYWQAGRDSAGSMPIVSSDGEVVPSTTEAARRTNTGGVINLIRVNVVPVRIEQRIQAALQSIDERLTVQRLQRSAVPDIAQDLLILEGNVESQVQLVRALHVIASLYLGTELEPDDIEVVADEAGALTRARNFGYLGSNNSFLNSSLNGGGGAGNNLFGNSQAGNLTNRVGANLGRSTVISVADGRILSFVEVDDLPLIRVDFRFYEVNRNDLLSFSPDLTTVWADFDLPSVSGAVGETDARNTLGFLAGGLTERAEVSLAHFTLDAIFQLLESRGIARTLSKPSISVLSGEQAVFQVGGEVPITESFSPAFGGQTSDDITPGVFSRVVFRRFGVQLQVRPLLGEDGTITLDVLSQVAQPDQALTEQVRDSTGSDLGSTAFETRAVGTSIRLENGQSLLLGGLISHDSSDEAAYAPWLHRIPLLGWMFKRFAVQDEATELFVTVHPVITRSPSPQRTLWKFADGRQILREMMNQ